MHISEREEITCTCDSCEVVWCTKHPTRAAHTDLYRKRRQQFFGQILSEQAVASNAHATRKSPVDIYCREKDAPFFFVVVAGMYCICTFAIFPMSIYIIEKFTEKSWLYETRDSSCFSFIYPHACEVQDMHGMRKKRIINVPWVINFSIYRAISLDVRSVAVYII